MGTLYLLGGLARSGKTTVFKEIVFKKPIISVTTDSLRASVRNVLLDEPYVTVEEIAFNGTARFRRPGSLEIVEKKFTSEANEDELTWKAVLGFINPYDRKDIDVFVEGIAITPERVSKLQLKNLTPRAAFLGFSDPHYIDTIIKHAHEQKNWVYTVIQEHGGDESEVRRWFAESLEKNKELERMAKEHGYQYFDASSKSFEEYISEVTTYLLGDRI